MTETINNVLAGMIGRDIDVDLAIAESAYVTSVLRTKIQELQDEIAQREAMIADREAKVAEAQSRLIDMQTILDQYLIDFENRPAPEPEE